MGFLVYKSFVGDCKLICLFSEEKELGLHWCLKVNLSVNWDPLLISYTLLLTYSYDSNVVIGFWNTEKIGTLGPYTGSPMFLSVLSLWVIIVLLVCKSAAALLHLTILKDNNDSDFPLGETSQPVRCDELLECRITWTADGF